MADKVMCPICGRMLDPDVMEYLDNGSPACPECVIAERSIEENKQDE